MHIFCILKGLITGFQRIFACFSLFFVLHAITPGVFFGLSLLDADAESKNAVADPIAEEEDENSDAKLKFLPPGIGADLPVILISFPKADEIPVSGFVEEIPTPPPLI